MKRISVVIAALLIISSDSVAQTNKNTSVEKHPVEAFFLSGIEAFNAHDLDRFMKQFAGDIEMYTPTGWLRSQAAVRERFASTFKQFASVRMEVEDLRVREVGPGSVVTDFKWRVYPGGRGPAFHGIGTGVYVLRNGGWVEVLEHETVTKVDEGLGSQRK
jgi:hypothetical protein